jgi:hypothetical protein
VQQGGKLIPLISSNEPRKGRGDPTPNSADDIARAQAGVANAREYPMSTGKGAVEQREKQCIHRTKLHVDEAGKSFPIVFLSNNALAI